MGLESSNESSDSLSDSTIEKLNIIKSSSKTLLTIINDILDYSKIVAGKLDVEHIDFDLHKLISEEAELFQFLIMEKGIKFYLTIDDHVPRFINSDPTRLKQILNNLLSNSIKFTSKGSIGLIVSCLNDNSLNFSIRDTGIGIEQEDISKLFTKFTQADDSTTRSYGGTGLGLSISQSLSELLGGGITIESTYGQGTTVSFTIQYNDVKDSSQVVNESHSKIELSQDRLKDLKVLVVEDNAINKTIALGMLSKLGISANHAVNGLEALSKLSEEQFDICFMDCHMPVMDGFEATKQIIEKLEAKRPYIIALTASAMKADVNRCFDSGMDDFLSKPVSITGFYEVIKKWELNT